PRTAGDIERALETFERCVRFAGVTAADTYMCSLPLGIHPAGQQLVRAAERIGAATIWAGAGNQTPSAMQAELIHDLGATVWCGMPSFGVNLAHIAEAARRPLADSAVGLLITTAEMLSPAKRALLERLWGARVVDVFGMSEIGLMAVECGRRPGLHCWREHSFCEVLDPETLEPTPPGEVGVLCVSPVAGGEALPFIRWLSGDIVRAEYDCDCEAAGHPRLVHSGRTLNFSKLRGVNLNHAEIEDALYALESIVDFRVRITAEERLVVEVEAAADPANAVAELERLFRERFEVRAEPELVARGTIARAVEGQLKAQRFVDERPASAG
ncbi:MAG: phenylacetate--CoA ligase family protein, partial [Candidatus Binatia bacterium]